MASPPPEAKFKHTDYPENGLGTRAALEKFFIPMNAALSATKDALSGKITFAQNLNCEVKTISLTTPATDWITPTLNAGWTLYAGGEPASYRKDSMGTVYVRGLVTSAAGGTAFVLPAGYRPDSPASFASALSIGGVESHGRLVVDNVGNVAFPAVAPTTFGSLRCAFTCAGAIPGVLSCFPFSATTTVKHPKGVVLIQTYNKGGGNVPGSPGSMDVTFVKGGFRVNNIPGLLLASRYTLTVLVIGG